MASDELNVAVAVATRDRPVSCRRLIGALLAQELPDEWQLRIIVVNNDPSGSELDLPSDSRLEVLHEPEPGIPFARNRGVERALPWADVIAFIDDDEAASPSWLRTLVEGLDRYDADVVSGPIISVFPTGTPTWITEHPVFQRRLRHPGEQLTETYTGNTAARSEVFADGRRFAPEFRTTGGSDTHLFRQAHQAGARIRWVAEAVVEESVSAERARVGWILTRSFRIGANRVQFLRAGPAPATRWLTIVAGSGAELLLGLASPVVAIASRRQALVLLGRAARGLGTYAALFGVRYSAYR
ncbi:MAG: glycosyltransferase [Dehalococcoidia bacterium]